MGWPCLKHESITDNAHQLVPSKKKPSEKQQLPPQLFKPCRIGCRINDGVLNVPVPQIILDQTGIGTLVSQDKPASMAQHVWMRRHRQPRLFPIITDRDPRRLAA